MANTQNSESKKLPESLTLKIEYTLTLEELNEYDGIPLEEITLQVMLDKLREYANDDIDFNTIETANVYDENGELVAGDDA